MNPPAWKHFHNWPTVALARHPSAAEGHMQFGLPQRLFVCLMSALFVCSFLSGGTSLAQNSVTHTPSAPLAKLTLRVYNYARTDPASLTSAEKVADAILEKAGIEATWVNCPLSPKEVQAYPS